MDIYVCAQSIKSSCDPFIHDLNVKQSRLACMSVGFQISSVDDDDGRF